MFIHHVKSPSAAYKYFERVPLQSKTENIQKTDSSGFLLSVSLW